MFGAFKSRLRDGLRLALARHRSRLGGSYPDYPSALHACQGYEDARIVEVVHAKTQRFAQELAQATSPLPLDDVRLVLSAAMHAARQSQHAPLTVIDFGGACGAHYHLARHLLREPRGLRWCVVETPAMAEAAGHAQGDADLAFRSTPAAAVEFTGGVDLVYCNNAVQYVPDPLATLAMLLHLGAGTVCISKLPVAGVPHVLYTRQTSNLSENGPGPLPAGVADTPVSYPLGILPCDAVLRLLAVEGNRVQVFRHANPLFHEACGLIEYHSFVVHRPDAVRA